jgi:hypothetical protein
MPYAGAWRGSTKRKDINFGENLVIMTWKEPDTGRLNGGAGLRAITEVVVGKQGFNPDDLLVARTCRGCGRLLLGAAATDISDREGYRVMVDTPDGHRYVLRASELLTPHCRCGRFYAIITYGPSEHGRVGYFAYTVVELNHFSDRLDRILSDMERSGDAPAGLDEGTGNEVIGRINQAIRLTGKKGFAGISDDWSEARYCSGWIDL